MRVLIAILAISILAGCSDSVTLVIKADDYQKTFEVALDVPFEVWLPSNPSTGFGWSTETLDGLDIGEPLFVQEGTGVGAAGQDRFVVTARKPGSYFLLFEYSRPWEDVPAERVFTVVVETS
ncbi:MAG: protease inhibitor I42 family protein [Acidimicrobiia bacterium]|nr:protease inhibitor I42 family protein [Acidimicrobiia bacterium]